jgi:tyrosyl-tRNA synthetase
VSAFYGQQSGIAEADQWSRDFSERRVPTVMDEILVERMNLGLRFTFRTGPRAGTVMNPTGLSTTAEKWSRLLVTLGLMESGTKAENLIKGGGFEIDGQRVNDPSSKLDLTRPGSYVLEIGKKRKFVRVVVE